MFCTWTNKKKLPNDIFSPAVLWPELQHIVYLPSYAIVQILYVVYVLLIHQHLS